jgi:hypothetical protein
MCRSTAVYEDAGAHSSRGAAGDPAIKGNEGFSGSSGEGRGGGGGNHGSGAGGNANGFVGWLGAHGSYRLAPGEKTVRATKTNRATDA